MIDKSFLNRSSADKFLSAIKGIELLHDTKQNKDLGYISKDKPKNRIVLDDEMIFSKFKFLNTDGFELLDIDGYAVKVTCQKSRKFYFWK